MPVALGISGFGRITLSQSYPLSINTRKNDPFPAACGGAFHIGDGLSFVGLPAALTLRVNTAGSTANSCLYRPALPAASEFGGNWFCFRRVYPGDRLDQVRAYCGGLNPHGAGFYLWNCVLVHLWNFLLCAQVLERILISQAAELVIFYYFRLRCDSVRYPGASPQQDRKSTRLNSSHVR